MKVQALCCQSFARSVKRAAGVAPLTSPPVTLDTSQPEMLEGFDLLYIKLHGLPDEIYWYGDNWTMTLSVEQVRQACVNGAVAFVANCHSPDGPMLKALFDAGASYVVGGSGIDYAGRRRVYGADLLGLAFRRMLQAGFGPRNAFSLARAYVASSRYDRFVRDALDFHLYCKTDVRPGPQLTQKITDPGVNHG